MKALTSCPGMYCGRELLPGGNWSDCGACPRGYRADEESVCSPCADKPAFYDWLYLSFMILMPLVLHWSCIDTISMRRNIPKEVVALHLSALLEVALAFLITLQLMPPMGTFDIVSCKTKKLSDWYTLLHNPRPNYEDTLYCTQEAVYPLLVYVSLRNFSRDCNVRIRNIHTHTFEI